MHCDDGGKNMRKSLVALLLAAGATAFVANLALAAVDETENLTPKFLNSSMAKELQSRASRLGASATAVDTTYVGYTPGHSADNYWSIWSGNDKFSVPSGPYHRPPAKGAMWDWEPPYTDVHGDSLQGWWSIRQQMSGTGGLTIPDHLRPWRALDYGNIANHGVGNHTAAASRRTFGVIGVWHVDGGNSVGAPGTTTWTGEPAGSGGVGWAPLAGTRSAWMGLRRHGDNTHTDAITRNPFNEDVMMFDWFGAVSTGGTDKKFPGYGTQMDQMLYRDINVATLGANNLTVGFKYQTEMSTGFGTTNTTRSGWFVHDPLTVITGGANPNFIRNDPAVATVSVPPPSDSLMVYLGAPAEGSVVLSDGLSHSIYDSQRRWFGEVIRSNEGLYTELLSKGGNNALTTASVVVPNATVNTVRAGGQIVRLVFRVKTNHTFDDELKVAVGYSSLGRGAAQVDDVTVNLGGGPTTIGNFEALTDIDNSTGVSALTKWKSTGKPPQPFTHIHQLTPDIGLTYQDLCGQVGNPARICDMQGKVLSAGDHDNSERSGHPDGASPESEPFQGIWSPTINLKATGAIRNNMGLNQSEADATDDYYIDYELYTGIYDFFSQGNAWRFGWQNYPAGNTTSGAGEHQRWGEPRYPAFIYFNPDKQCFRNLDAVKGNGLLRTTNGSGVPDSCRIFVGSRQETYRFGITQHDWEDGSYWDNLSLAIVDGAGADPVSVDIWQLYHDTFPANDTPGLAGIPAAFDTTTALMKNGLNNAPTTGNTSRFDVPGDTTQFIAEGDSVRVDLVFRILPGPGNYVNAAIGSASQLRKLPTANTPVSGSPAVTSTNFWESYMANNGAKGSVGHPTAASGPLAGQKVWSPQVWNSARCDTAEANVFNLTKRGIIQPGNAGQFMTAYHEDDLAIRTGLGIARNVCFVADTSQTVAVTAVICGGNNGPFTYPPAYTGAPGSGYNGQTTTKEGTKILPDGLFTPGTHVEYFFRRQDGTDPNIAFCPDTNQVTPQNSEGSVDGHRWQEFSVLPDRWKSPSYTHPVLGVAGRGDACMLYVDQNDRRGNERTWVGVSDSIGATHTSKYGAHNGWHAPGDGDVNDPANFVRRHIGSAGTTWDMYGVKAAESLNSGAGSLGSRGGVSAYSFSNPANTQIDGKSSRQGPSLEMLEAYYKILFFLSGDLNSSVWGPFNNKSQNDVKIVQDFLLSGNTASPDRGIFAEGDGFLEALDGTSNESFNFMVAYLGVELRNVSYLAESGNTAFSAEIQPTAEVDTDGDLDIYGVRNACTFTLDVPDRAVGLAGETAEASFYEPFGAGAPYISGVVKHHTASHPWIALVDGWDIENLRARDEISSRGRLTYFYNVFTNIFSAICDVAGAPDQTSDTPDNNDGRLFNFMSLANNPYRSGTAAVNFGLARAERVKIQIFDVSGRLVRTLADRNFIAGEHRLTWDGVDNAGKMVSRGVYFVRSQHADSKFQGQSKLIVLK
jgi:hypothetical protein